jgi:hypothetical protein
MSKKAGSAGQFDRSRPSIFSAAGRPATTQSFKVLGLARMS